MSEAAAQPAAGASLQQRVLREHLASVYADLNAAVLGHVGTSAALIAFIYARQRTVSALFLFLVAWHVAVQLLTYFSPRWTPAEPVSADPAWARRYAWSSAVMSSPTLPLTLGFISPADPVLTTLLSLAVLGTCTRGLQARWPFRAAMFAYSVPPAVGLLGSLAWHGGLLGWVLAGFCAVNFTLALRAGLVQNRRVNESLMLRFENEALAAQLREQVAMTERLSAEKTRFLATASHDLRQPMHAIALFGAAMRNALHDHPERANAERLMGAVHVLGTSLDTLLDISRLDAGVVVPEPRPQSLDALFAALHDTFAARAEEKKLQLRLRASGLWVRSDAQLLQRMLSNLIDNALKYTAEGGVLVVARARGDMVWLDVYDTGIGIAPDQVGRIFEEFYQVDNAGRDRARGLGIGLAIVQRLARLLQHTVQVHSRLGRGTRVRLRLPLSAPAEPPVAGLQPSGEAEAAWALRPPVLQGPILLIDDEEEIREAMASLLQAFGIEVIAVAREAEAVAVLSRRDAVSKPIALLACDYRLAEGVDGLALGLRLRARFGLQAPLLLITGETAPERLQRVRDAGVPALFKPVDAAVLLRTIAELAEPPARGPAAPYAQA